ncbi:MAG: hypothetical protein QF444_04920, partial [Phycisphaerales bacterium]|nr:hypothetical protein [Phycisphaerales bacterium]
MIKRPLVFIGTILIAFAPVFASGRGAVITTINDSDLVSGSEEGQAWRILFDACLQMTEPPQPLGAGFNMNTIW